MKDTINQILPEMEIVNNLEFEKNDADVLVATTFTRLGRKDFRVVDAVVYPNEDEIRRLLQSRNKLLEIVPFGGDVILYPYLPSPLLEGKKVVFV